MQTHENNGRAGWPVRAWCASANVSPATFYNLPQATRPASVKVGKRRIITEAPSDWLRRIADAGGA